MRPSSISVLTADFVHLSSAVLRFEMLPASQDLVPSRWQYQEMVEPSKRRRALIEMSRDCDLYNLSLPPSIHPSLPSFPFSLLPATTREVALSSHTPHHDVLPDPRPKAMDLNETSKTTSQNKPLFPLHYLSLAFCRSSGKVTNISVCVSQQVETNKSGQAPKTP